MTATVNNATRSPVLVESKQTGRVRRKLQDSKQVSKIKSGGVRLVTDTDTFRQVTRTRQSYTAQQSIQRRPVGGEKVIHIERD